MVGIDDEYAISLSKELKKFGYKFSRHYKYEDYKNIYSYEINSLLFVYGVWLYDSEKRHVCRKPGIHFSIKNASDQIEHCFDIGNPNLIKLIVELIKKYEHQNANTYPKTRAD